MGTHPTLMVPADGKEREKGWIKEKKVQLQTNHGCFPLPRGRPFHSHFQNSQQSTHCGHTPPCPSPDGLPLLEPESVGRYGGRAEGGPVSQQRLQGLLAPNPTDKQGLETRGHL